MLQSRAPEHDSDIVAVLLAGDSDRTGLWLLFFSLLPAGTAGYTRRPCLHTKMLSQLSCVCKYSCYEQLTAQLPGLARQAVGSDMLDLETMPCNCQAAPQLSLAHSCHQLSAVAVTHHWHPALCSYIGSILVVMVVALTGREIWTVILDPPPQSFSDDFTNVQHLSGFLFINSALPCIRQLTHIS